MCAHEAIVSKKKFYENLLFIYLIMITLAIFSGVSNIQFLKDLGLIISDIFIKIFRCISLPLIALSIIVTLASYGKGEVTNKLLQRTIFYTLSTTIIAAAVSCMLYLIIRPTNVSVNAIVLNQISSTSINSQINYWQHVTSIIPTNIFAPFLEHQVLGVLLVGIVTGIAVRSIPEDESRETVMRFFQGIHGLFLVITKWIVRIIPIGLYGFITVTVVQLRQGMDLSGIGEYLTVVILANAIQGLIILPLLLHFHGIKPFRAMHAMMPALSVAFFSKSSAGTLPITMATAEKSLNINPAISRFVLPLCTSINMNGCAAFIFATVIYLMQNAGIEITVATLLLWIVVATIAAIGNAGVPMGCFFLSASLLASMNVPITLLGIILPFYSLIDMMETSLNVWSDSCVAKVVDQRALNEASNNPSSA